MATLVDLNESAHAATHANCDVCVIGAGAAGLYLAHRLSRAGLHVVVLEAGGMTCGSGASVGIEPVFSASEYRGAVEGRAFGWGGSTSRWGGLLAPHSDADLRDEVSPESAAWSHVVAVVRERSRAVFAVLGLGDNVDFFSLPAKTLGASAKRLHDCGLETAAVEFLPFRRRNLSYLASARTSRNITVYLNAVASRWRVLPNTGGSGAVSAVEASSPSGKRLRLSGRAFVVAAGAIESARILMEIDRSAGERLFSRSAAVGRCLSDHLSCTIAHVVPEDLNQTARLFGPIFSKGRMRSYRFTDSSTDPVLPRHFAHFIFDIDNAGFRLVKDVLFGLQTRVLAGVRISNVIDGIRGLSKLGYHRLIKSSLFIPPRTPAHLQLDIEQSRDPANRVHLGTQTDRAGRPIAVVHWRISEIDHKNIHGLSRRLIMKWPEHACGFPRLVSVGTGDTRTKPYDAYHPVGTCRMGSDSDATVDLDLRVSGAQNLYVLSTGVFPSAGTANPTFSMLCLGDRLADKMTSHHFRSNIAG